ncbi:unnamed protein product [Rangifer tarandus platyrhynchus]|uniref:Uncharacterized protein n=1 Tax=Rangifer tarandus platyrhynchus TaxID=3082113 RepID=A0ABN8Y6H9_RANTA|nr:unnamed protein product [Rangifer tarandus platyrhynchus]
MAGLLCRPQLLWLPQQLIPKSSEDITDSFHALGDLRETRATSTSKLHMHLARDAQKQRTWRELPQPESRSVMLTIAVGRTAAVSLLPSKPQAKCLS